MCVTHHLPFSVTGPHTTQHHCHHHHHSPSPIITYYFTSASSCQKHPSLPSYHHSLLHFIPITFVTINTLCLHHHHHHHHHHPLPSSPSSPKFLLITIHHLSTLIIRSFHLITSSPRITLPEIDLLRKYVKKKIERLKGGKVGAFFFKTNIKFCT